MRTKILAGRNSQEGQAEKRGMTNSISIGAEVPLAPRFYDPNFVGYTDPNDDVSYSGGGLQVCLQGQSPFYGCASGGWLTAHDPAGDGSRTRGYGGLTAGVQGRLPMKLSSTYVLRFRPFAEIGLRVAGDSAQDSDAIVDDYYGGVADRFTAAGLPVSGSHENARLTQPLSRAAAVGVRFELPLGDQVALQLGAGFRGVFSPGSNIPWEREMPVQLAVLINF